MLFFDVYLHGFPCFFESYRQIYFNTCHNARLIFVRFYKHKKTGGYMSEKRKSIEITRIKRTIHTQDGTPLLLCAADKITIERMDTLNELYNKVCDNCLEYCEHTLIHKCQPPNLYAYKLTCKTSEDNDTLTVDLKATFTDRTSRKILSSATYTHVWSDNGYLIKQKKRKSRSPKRLSPKPPATTE